MKRKQRPGEAIRRTLDAIDAAAAPAREAIDRILVDLGLEPTTPGRQRRTRPVDLTLSRKRAGHKPDPDYDRAYELLLQGRTADDVFDWFCEVTNVHDPDQSYRDAFKKAMRRRMKRT